MSAVHSPYFIGNIEGVKRWQRKGKKGRKDRGKGVAKEGVKRGGKGKRGGKQLCTSDG